MRVTTSKYIASALAATNLAGAVFRSTERVYHEQSLSALAEFPSLSGPFNLSVPIDHFHNESRYEPHSDDTFPLRYWLSTSHFRAGGPVFLLASGETSAQDRLPFLDHGIIARLAEATHGAAAVLEHRYYGTSFPVSDMSVPNMRFLSTDQALADTAFFAQNVVFPGLEWEETGPKDVPWIAYGGSYAGAFVAFLRKLYPDVFAGAIASSAVTEAIVDYWEYFEAARLFAPGDCGEMTARLTEIVDRILLGEGRAQESDKAALKRAFGLEGLAHDDDFANVLARGVEGLQGGNWDPEVDRPAFGLYCGSVQSDAVLFASTRHLDGLVTRLLKAAGIEEAEAKVLHPRMMNFIGYVRQDVKKVCSQGDVEKCFAARGREHWKRTDLVQGWERSWTWQVCTEWGYFQTGSGVPSDQRPLVSRLIDLNYTSIPCVEAFNITEEPDVDVINKHGGFGFSYPRLAFVDGEADPWRAATPHRIGLPERESTTSEPFILIGGGAVHHWDENGLQKSNDEGEGKHPENSDSDLPPEDVKMTQDAEVEFVKAWIKEWRDERGLVEGDGWSEEL